MSASVCWPTIARHMELALENAAPAIRTAPLVSWRVEQLGAVAHMGGDVDMAALAREIGRIQIGLCLRFLMGQAGLQARDPAPNASVT